MRIGIMSDSHGNTMAVEQAVKKAGKVDMWLHAGDLEQDAEYLAMLTEIDVAYVPGNCDWPNAKAPAETLIEVAGHKIFMTHGDMYGVRYDTQALEEAAAEKGADIAVYGHTHVADISPKETVYVVNPGSVARPRDEARPSFMLMDLEPGKAPKVKLLRMAI